MIGHRSIIQRHGAQTKGWTGQETTDGVGESMKSATSVTGLGKVALVCIWKCCPGVLSKGWSSAGLWGAAGKGGEGQFPSESM